MRGLLVTLLVGWSCFGQSLQTIQIATGLGQPTDIQSAGDGSGRLFVLDQPGVIRIVRAGSVAAQPFLDIRSKVLSGGERGLLGLTFPPDFSNKQRFYVNYTDLNGNTVVASYRVSANRDVADASSEVVLLHITQPFENHNGGQLRFGPDGYMYVGMGDGGGAGDPSGNGQSRGTMLGKMLRIDVETAPGTVLVPADNPFVNQPGTPTIWALGLRNPWRFSFDRATGDLWIADVGQGSYEEVNFQPQSSRGGENYGWNRMEGLHCFTPNCDPTGLTLPVSEYTHDDGCSITGGFVYRGSQSPSLVGTYVFSDLCSGTIWGLKRQGSQLVREVLLKTGFSVTTFGEDESGEVYFTDYNTGAMYQIVAPAVFSPVCSYAIDSGGQALTAGGGTATVAVSTGSGCAWNATTDLPWVSVRQGGSGSGAGQVTLDIAANAGGPRTGAVAIAGLAFTIQQAAVTASPASSGSIAQVVAGGVWKTTLTLLNLGAASADVKTDFLDDGGAPLPLALNFPQELATGPTRASTVERSLPSGSQLLMETAGPENAAGQGWARVSTNGSVNGFAMFSNSVTPAETTVPMETRVASSYIVPFDNTGTLVTGIAIANLDSQNVGVSVTLWDDSGTNLGTDSLTLTPQGHMAFVSSLKYVSTSGKRGTVEFATGAGGKISVLGLRMNGTAFSAAPVFTTAEAQGGTIPHIVTNGGYKTTFVIVNTSSIPTVATLNLFDETGSALAATMSLPQSGTTVTGATVARTLAPQGMLLIEMPGADNLPLMVGSAQLVGSVSGFAVVEWSAFGQQEVTLAAEAQVAARYVLAFDNTNGLTTGVALANGSSATVQVGVNIRDEFGVLLQSDGISIAGQAHTAFMLPDKYPSAAGRRGSIEFSPSPGQLIGVFGLRVRPDHIISAIPVSRQ